MNTVKRPEPAGSPGILIVDDVPANLELLAGILRDQGYEPRPVPGGRLALQAARAAPPDLILLDINMPEMNGFEVCERLKADEALRDIPVLFITADAVPADKVKAFAMGAVDYITKPFQVEEVVARVATHLRLRRLQLEMEKHSAHLEELVQDKIRELNRSQMATIFALARLAESRDDQTGRHLDRVQILCRVLAGELRCTRHGSGAITDRYVETIYQAAPLHDIGKVGIPDAILLKPGKLTAEEFDSARRHVAIGAGTLRAVHAQYPGNEFIAMGLDIAQSHHEKYDGTGYPEGLRGDAIPLSARIMAVADVYDALRSQRPYKPALPHDEAKDIIIKSSGTHFDPAVVAAFAGRARDFEDVYVSRMDLENEAPGVPQ
jgi:putative two-component system response regulator